MIDLVELLSMKVYYVGENRKGYKYGKMYINVMGVCVWNTIKLCMYKKYIMFAKSLSTYCILTHIFRYWKNMTLSTTDWEEKKRKEMHYTNSTVTDIDCHDDNINSNIQTSW